MKNRKLTILIVIIFLLTNFITFDVTLANQSNEIPSATQKTTILNQSSSLNGSDTPSFGVEVKDSLFLELADGDIGEPNNHWVRINGLIWSDVQPDDATQTNWNSALDEKLQDAYEAGMEIILIIRSTPDWARSHEYFCGPMDPDYIDEFADFMANTVLRYSVPPDPYTYSIKYYEIWNEPDDIPQVGLENNVHGCWGDPEDPDYWGGDYYGQVLKSIYPEVTTVNPEAQIVIGGLLLPCEPETDNYCNMSNFFEGILQSEQGEGWPYFDYVAYHGYPFYDPELGALQQETPNDPVGEELYWTGWNSRGGLVAGKLDFLRSVMTTYGIDKPVLLTEGGLTDPNEKASDLTEIEKFESTKADYLVWLYTRNIAKGIEGTIWYHMEDYGWNKSGLLDETNTPLPAYDAYAVLTNTLGGAVYLRDLSDLGEGIRGFEFKQENRIWVLFTEDGIQKQIDTPSYFSQAYDLLGAPIEPTGGVISFTRPIYVEFINAPPIADDQSVTTDEDNEVDITLTAEDIDGDMLTWSYTDPVNGTLIGTAPDLTYTPNVNYNGTDSFTFAVTDPDEESDQATVKITVNPIEDIPVAYDQNVNTDEETPKMITLTGFDGDGDDLIYAITDTPDFGTLSDIDLPILTYTPELNFQGSDSLSFIVSDGDNSSNVATVTITVDPVNDPPIFNSDPILTATQDSLYIYDIEADDVDFVYGDSLEITVADGTVLPSWLNLTDYGGGNGKLEGTPLNADVGAHDVSLVVTDDSNATDIQDFTITVVNVNDAPTDIELDPKSVEENQVVGTLVGTFSTEDVDVGDTHTYALVTGPGDGDNDQFSISGDQLLTNAVFNYEEKNSYSIRVQSTDSGGEPVQKDFIISVLDINDEPVAEDQILFTSQNTPLPIDLSKFVSDEDSGNELTMEVTVDPVHGILSGDEPDMLYTPDTGYTGLDSFTFSVSDGEGGSDTAVVTISVAESDCLSVNTTYIYEVLPQDSTEILTLPLENTCDYEVGYEMVERETIIRQDFEEGLMPPTGWLTKVGDEDDNGEFEWTLKDALETPLQVDEGRYAAWAGFEAENYKDEWLLSPEFNPSGLSDILLTFRAYSSTEYWVNAKMQIWVTDADGNPITDFSEEPIWDMIRDENWDGGAHRTVFIDLSDFAGYANSIRIAWRYVGVLGNSVGVDMVDVSTSSELSWISVNPTWGTLPASETVDINLNFDTSGLAIDTYFGTIQPSPLAPLPVAMDVIDDTNQIYLPLILK